jgi:hypothetical protein
MPAAAARPDDAASDGVLAPLLFARAAQRLCSHPSLWLSGELLSGFSFGIEPTCWLRVAQQNSDLEPMTSAP